MDTRKSYYATPPHKVTMTLKRLGADMRTARLRRNLSLDDVAGKLGVSRQVISHAENGKPTTSIAIYAGILWAVGLLNRLEDVADPAQDKEGQQLELSRERKNASTSKGRLSNAF
jgi:transcriptional regulator with XRE-family HTH domain